MDTKSRMEKMKLKTALKEIDQKGDHTKEYNLSMKGKKITLEEVSEMSEKVWTKAQEEYLDKRFGALEQDMSEVKSDLKLIIDHLGIKK